MPVILSEAKDLTCKVCVTLGAQRNPSSCGRSFAPLGMTGLWTDTVNRKISRLAIEISGILK